MHLKKKVKCPADCTFEHVLGLGSNMISSLVVAWFAGHLFTLSRISEDFCCEIMFCVTQIETYFKFCLIQHHIGNRKLFI